MPDLLLTDDTHDNVFIVEPSSAAYGGNSLKSDFGGHSNFHHDNLDLFFDKGYGITGQLPGLDGAKLNKRLSEPASGRSPAEQTNAGKTTKRHVALLDGIGLDWDPNATAWAKLLAQLVVFKEKSRGCTIVPKSCLLYTSPSPRDRG